MSTYKSSLNQQAISITFVACLVLLAAAAYSFYKAVYGLEAERGASIAGGVLATIILVSVFAFSPTAVKVNQDRLIVIRRLGNSSFDLSKLTAVTRTSRSEISGLIRLFAVGGVFGWYGRFRSRDLGSFSMYATRLDNLLVIDFSKKRIVVSADDVDGLYELLAARISSKRS